MLEFGQRDSWSARRQKKRDLKAALR